MRAALAFATLLSLVSLEPAIAQDWTAPRSTDAATRKWEKAPPAPAAKKRAQPNDGEAAAAEARARNEARERAWDAKAKRTMRSICSGASGC
jgi:hypothetical protein